MNAIFANVYAAYKKQLRSRALDFNHAQRRSLKARPPLAAAMRTHDALGVSRPCRP